jgi:hypothetical protein
MMLNNVNFDWRLLTNARPSFVHFFHTEEGKRLFSSGDYRRRIHDDMHTMATRISLDLVRVEKEDAIASWSEYPPSSLAFLPDFTEHPKPKKKKLRKLPTEQEENPASVPRLPAEDDEGDEITFFHDFVAGGVAGCASVVVGHPFDT